MTGGWTMPTALIVASSSASACGVDFVWRVRSGFSFSARGSTLMRCMGTLLLGVADRRCRPFLVFFPKTPPGPRSGRAGATAAEHPCPAGPAGLTSPAQDDGPGSRRRRLSASDDGPPVLRAAFPAYSRLLFQPPCPVLNAATSPQTHASG